MASIFTKIINGEIKGEIVYQDDLCAVIVDIQAQAPVHYLVVPKKELASVAQAKPEDKQLLGHLMYVAAEVARKEGFSERGYRLVVNTHQHGGQSVSHLHIHLLGGRQMDWPPG